MRRKESDRVACCAGTEQHSDYSPRPVVPRTESCTLTTPSYPRETPGLRLALALVGVGKQGRTRREQSPHPPDPGRWTTSDGPMGTVHLWGAAFPLMGALLWPHVATLARLLEGARSRLPECGVSTRPTLRRGRRFHNATRMPTPSSGLGSSSWPARVQQGQWPGLCPDGWDSPHPSCSCSSTASHARPSAASDGQGREGISLPRRTGPPSVQPCCLNSPPPRP